jgi:hypothetical protein
MPASSILSSVRTPLKTAIAGVAANVYDSVPEAPIVPFAAIVPNTPYLQPNFLSKSNVKLKVNLVITVGVAIYDNQSALDNIEQLAISILAALPTGYEVGDVTNPINVTVGASEILALEIPVATYYTQTN